MESIKLSTLSLVLGVLVSAISAYGLVRPEGASKSMKKFPRSLLWGYALMALGTCWFLYYLSLESVSDFAEYKPMMYGGFTLLGVLSCIFLTDFLAVRGLAIVLMLLGKLIVDTAHLDASPWKLVLVTWAYIMVVAGIWFTISPWRCRDWLDWCSANESRIRLASATRLVFGLLLVGLGLVVF